MNRTQSQSEMKIRDYVAHLEDGKPTCIAEQHQTIAYGWMVVALWLGSLALVESLIILYLIWR